SSAVSTRRTALWRYSFRALIRGFWEGKAQPELRRRAWSASPLSSLLLPVVGGMPHSAACLSRKAPATYPAGARQTPAASPQSRVDSAQPQMRVGPAAELSRLPIPASVHFHEPVALIPFATPAHQGIVRH